MLAWIYGPVLAAKADKFGTYAAALAYCLVLSLIPFLVVTFVLGTALTHENLINAYSALLDDILPNQEAPALLASAASAPPKEAVSKTVHGKMEKVKGLSARIVRTLEWSSHTGGITIIGFIFAVYTSFNLMTQIVRTLLYIFDDHRRPLDWSTAIVLKTLLLFGIWTLLLLLFSVCSIITPIIASVLESFHLNPVLWTDPLLWMRDLAGLGLLFGAFFLTYMLVPTKRYKFAQIRNGSLVAALGWVLGSLLFARVLPHIWRANPVYEALGSIVIILIWAQTCAWSVILGACCIVRFPGRRQKR